MKKNYLLLALITLVCVKAISQPTVAAPAPTAPSGTVLSLFGSHYTAVAQAMGVGVWTPGWGQATAVTFSKIGADSTIVYTGLNYQGVAFNTPPNINALSYDSIHLDIWSNTCTKVNFHLISTPTAETGPDLTLNSGSWTSVTLPLSAFTPTVDLGNIFQMKFTAVTPATGSTIYLENIYFKQVSGKPVITGFNVPSTLNQGQTYTITTPTSTSTGVFTYSSSNTAVATVSGNVITAVAGGTCVITATQAPANGYLAGSAAANLTVPYPVPLSPAPTPNVPASHVVSLYGNTYTNVAGTNWFPGWGQTTVASTILLGGDSTLYYQTANYQGVQLAGSVDASAMQFLHLDVWTPNSTALDVNLINTAPPNAALVQQKSTVYPTLNKWNSFDIPLSAYNNISLKAINQLMFVDTPFGKGTVYIENIYFWRANGVPVKFENIQATKSGNNAIINWKTVNETNNKGFDVQKSFDGVNWVTFKSIVGKGNSSISNDYSILDNNPFNGTSYYRIIQIDNTGSKTYSNTVSLSFLSKYMNLSFYPNPVKNTMIVSLPVIDNSSANLNIISMNGKVIKTVKLNTLNTSSNVALDVSTLSNGVYILMLKDGLNISSSKFVVEN